MLPQSHAHLGGSQRAAPVQANLHAYRVIASPAAAGSTERREDEAEGAAVVTANAEAYGFPPFAKQSTQDRSTRAEGPSGVLANEALRPTDALKDIQQDAKSNSSHAGNDCGKDSPGKHHLGLRQLAFQSVLLLVSWISLAVFQPNGRPLLLIAAIALSRLHLGWLLCCILRMVLPRYMSTDLSEDPEAKKLDQGRLSAFVGRLGYRCWTRMPLRYWHCAFYLLLLLAAFWAASVVWEDSQEGLQALQGGGGTALPSTQTWLGGGLSPLLLNSDSPQHVKIAATAVARGREASDYLLWLLHSAAQQKFGRVLLLLRSFTFWINSFLLQPFVAVLGHTGLFASVNGTCSLSDAPEVSPDSGDPQEGWLMWLQTAVQNAVRSLPSAAHTFLCGERTGGSICREEEAAAWRHIVAEAPPDFGGEGSAVEIGPYCLALVLLLVYSLSAALHRVCLAGFAAIRHTWFIWSLQDGSTTRPLGESLGVACKSALTAFAVAFVLLALLWGAAAATSRGVALVRLVWGHLLGKTSSECERNGHTKAAKCSSSSCRPRVGIRRSRGNVGLEILAACLTCWVLLLSDREFVMFTWVTLQPLRLSVLSTVLLLRLPSSQVATLLAWPPPLREPALVLQRSQPLKIIDPVAVGSMLGCVLAAAALRLLLNLVVRLGGLVRRPFASSRVNQADGGVGLLGVSRGHWKVRSSSPSGSDSPAPSTLLQKLQEQNGVIAELQASLEKERCRATLAEELIAKLKEAARTQTILTPPEVNGDTSPHALPVKPHADSRHRLASPGEICRGQAPQTHHQDHGKQHNDTEKGQQKQQNQEQQRQQQQLEGNPRVKDLQQQVHGAAEQQMNVYAEQLQKAQQQLGELQRQLRGAQSQLMELQQKRDTDALAHDQRQQQLVSEAALWRGREGEARAECERLKVDLAEASRALEGLRRAHGGQQQEANVAQAEDKGHIKRMAQLLQKQTEELANKTAEINTLRSKLTQVATSTSRGSPSLVDLPSETPRVQPKRLVEQTEDTAPNLVVGGLLSKLDDITHGIKQNVENDTKTVNLHKTHFSSLGCRFSPNLSHSSNTVASGNTSDDTESQLNHSSRDTAFSGDDPPLLEDPTSVDPSPRRNPGAFRRLERKEALSKEEYGKLDEALQTIGKCIFPLRTVLEHLDLPQATLDAARRLLETTTQYTGDSARLQEILAHPSNCTWEGDVKLLATDMEVLGQAWPSEESCRRLLQRQGDVHTLSPVEQKFLPFADLPQGRKRVAMMQFVLGLDVQWQAACRRLDRMEASLCLLRRSTVLRTLCATCAALHEEMNRACTFEAFEGAGGTEAEKETTGITASTAPTPWCTRIWKTSKSCDAALREFAVWKDNGDFNFACLKNAASICPPALQGFSLLHLILSVSGVAACEGEIGPTANGEGAEVDSTFPNRLKTEIYGGTAPFSSSSPSDAKSTAISPASCPSTAAAPTQKCDCAICEDADLAPRGPPRDWRRQLLMMKQQKIFRTPSRKTLSPSTDASHSQSPTAAAAAAEKQDTSPASDGLEAAIAIVTLYYDDLTGRQNKLADMGRHMQQEVSMASRFYRSVHGKLLGGASATSRTTSRSSSASSGTGGGETTFVRRVQAPPAAEAASVPGHVPTETERRLEQACQILKNIHSTVPLLTDAWSGFHTEEKVDALRVMAGLLETWPFKQVATDKTALAKSSLLSLEREAAPLRAMVAKASSAAVAAEAAVKAQEAARRVNASEGTAQPQRSVRQVEVNRLHGLGAGKQLHLEAADMGSQGSDRSIPCPTLLTGQTVSGQLTKGSRSRQPNTALPLPGKPMRRVGTGGNSSTNDSSAQARRPVSYSRGWSGASAAPPPKQLHGRIIRTNTQPTEAAALFLGRAGGKQAREPALSPPLEKSALTNGQQRRSSGPGDVLDSMACEHIPPHPRPEAADAATKTSAVSGGASTVQRSPQLEPALVTTMVQSDNGCQSAPSPCLLDNSDAHCDHSGVEEAALSGNGVQSQSAQQPKCLNPPDGAADLASGGEEREEMRFLEES
ncbi:hypothetical protein, conserved [Eimeria maxima]|uniref:Uncharacterized protein n=1 Tax=Eimeria maxima TaxID=5804 RepID=U6MB49_EIMMA|nr:hypothetical protein, conserved [Eimeria maxima]CDJ61251.1 hypothetical protein, conserved [Eimeria maxima]